MYNGIGLQTARGSGTNGYVQTNKFFVRPKTSKGGFDGNKGFGPDQGTAGLSKKPNTEILEHDRKRQIQLKLVILEDKLSEEGYTDAQIADKVDELREKLEAEAAAAAAAPEDGRSGAMTVSNSNMSDTQTHQVAARKEKQMEKLRAALGITVSDADAIKQGNWNAIDVDGSKDMLRNLKKDDGDVSEREEGEFFSGDEDMKIDKHHQDEPKPKHKASKKKQDKKTKGRRTPESSDSESTQETSDSESDSDRETKRKPRSTKTLKKVARDYSSDSGSESDEPYKGHNKVAKRHDSASESDSSRSSGRIARKSKQVMTKRRHDSESDNDPDDDRWRSTATPDRRELPIDSYKSKAAKVDDYDRKHENRYRDGSSKLRTDLRSDSSRGPKSEKVLVERSQRTRRYSDDESDPGVVQKKESSYRRGRHDSEEESDVERIRKESVKGDDDSKGHRKGKEAHMSKDDRVNNEHSYRKKAVEKDDRHRGRQDDDGLHNRKSKRDDVLGNEEDEFRSRKRERREENEQRDVKRVRGELVKDGGRKGIREESEHIVVNRERKEDMYVDRKAEKREEEVQSPKRREMREGHARHERREKMVEEDGGDRKNVRERGEQERREEIKDKGRRETRGDGGRASKRERRDGDENYSKKRERQDKDEERVGKRERRDDEEHAKRRNIRGGNDEEHRGRRSEDKESSRRYESDEVRRRK